MVNPDNIIITEEERRRHGKEMDKLDRIKKIKKIKKIKTNPLKKYKVVGVMHPDPIGYYDVDKRVESHNIKEARFKTFLDFRKLKIFSKMHNKALYFMVKKLKVVEIKN